MSAPAFALPPTLEAHEPPEARGAGRDDVRLMVATRDDGRIRHASFRDLPGFLDPGDLLVINTSATLPAAVPARLEDGTEVELRFATPAPRMPADWWVVELRCADGSSPYERPGAREALRLAGGATAVVVAPYAGGARLRLARFDADTGVEEYLARHGRPIRYAYASGDWPLDSYQTAYAIEPGSAEMPSAGRPFTPELVTALVARGILVAPITLHAGVSSPERHETPHAERYSVPRETAWLVDAVHAWDRRVVAVGTTVVRALETAAKPDGSVAASAGWTSLVITPQRGLRIVDGLITGWHEPEATHLQMLEAAAGAELLERSYASAIEHGYLWHEFGDSHLILRSTKAAGLHAVK